MTLLSINVFSENVPAKIPIIKRMPYNRSIVDDLSLFADKYTAKEVGSFVGPVTCCIVFIFQQEWYFDFGQNHGEKFNMAEPG